MTTARAGIAIDQGLVKQNVEESKGRGSSVPALVPFTPALAKFAMDFAAKPLDPRVANIAKRAFIDGIAVTLAGSREPAGRIAQRFAGKYGGQTGSRVIGTSLRCAPDDAALANGIAAHALDYDDRHSSVRGHPTAVLLPVVLAVGEDTGASGADVLKAYVIGLQVAGRIGRVVNMAHYMRGWHATATLGTIGGAVAAGSLLGLKDSGMRQAMGLAVSGAAGARVNFGSMTKPFHAGNAARNAVVAASLVHLGYTANENAVEGIQGFFDLYVGRENVRTDRMGDVTAPLELERPGVCLKFYPNCAGNHRAIDAILHLIHAHDIQPDDVSRVRVGVIYYLRDVLRFSRPQTIDEARFCMNFSMATALRHRSVIVEHYTNDALIDPLMKELMSRVEMYIHPDQMEESSAATEFAEVSITLKSGKLLSHRVEIPKGWPENDLTSQELQQKYASCARGALTPSKAIASLEKLQELESASSIDGLMEALAG